MYFIKYYMKEDYLYAKYLMLSTAKDRSVCRPSGTVVCYSEFDAYEIFRQLILIDTRGMTLELLQ